MYVMARAMARVHLIREFPHSWSSVQCTSTKKMALKKKKRLVHLLTNKYRLLLLPGTQPKLRLITTLLCEDTNGSEHNM